jgi:hypothetical protein
LAAPHLTFAGVALDDFRRAVVYYGAVKIDRGCQPPTEKVRIVTLKTFSAILDLTQEQLSRKQEKLAIGASRRKYFYVLRECGGKFTSAER